MIGAGPTWIIRPGAFVRDVLAAVLSCASGAPIGYWTFLVLYSVQTGSLPRRDEFLPPPVVIFFGAVAGGFIGIALRPFHTSIRQRRWAIGFFIAGIVISPLMLIALMAYVMAGRPY
jgi:hypothetical protein